MRIKEIKASDGCVLTLRDREGKTAEELPSYKSILMVDPDSLEELTQEEFDAIGKVIQTEEGDGTAMNPIKTWKVGDAVVKGKWYLTPENGYIWLCIKSGTPTSETDKTYFDVVGL